MERIRKPLNITLPPKLRKALDCYVAATEEKPTALISRLLREEFHSKGYDVTSIIADSPTIPQDNPSHDVAHPGAGGVFHPEVRPITKYPKPARRKGK